MIKIALIWSIIYVILSTNNRFNNIGIFWYAIIISSFYPLYDLALHNTWTFLVKTPGAKEPNYLTVYITIIGISSAARLVKNKQMTILANFIILLNLHVIYGIVFLGFIFSLKWPHIISIIDYVFECSPILVPLFIIWTSIVCLMGRKSGFDIKEIIYVIFSGPLGLHFTNMLLVTPDHNNQSIRHTKCRHCLTLIPTGAKICPNCHSHQNWLMRAMNYSTVIFSLLLAAISMLSLGITIYMQYVNNENSNTICYLNTVSNNYLEVIVVNRGKRSSFLSDMYFDYTTASDDDKVHFKPVVETHGLIKPETIVKYYAIIDVDKIVNNIDGEIRVSKKPVKKDIIIEAYIYAELREFNGEVRNMHVAHSNIDGKPLAVGGMGKYIYSIDWSIFAGRFTRNLKDKLWQKIDEQWKSQNSR